MLPYRSKRSLLVPPMIVTENQRAPFPRVIGRVRNTWTYHKLGWAWFPSSIFIGISLAPKTFHNKKNSPQEIAEQYRARNSSCASFKTFRKCCFYGLFWSILSTVPKTEGDILCNIIHGSIVNLLLYIQEYKNVKREK